MQARGIVSPVWHLSCGSRLKEYDTQRTGRKPEAGFGFGARAAAAGHAKDAQPVSSPPVSSPFAVACADGGGCAGNGRCRRQGSLPTSPPTSPGSLSPPSAARRNRRGWLLPPVLAYFFSLSSAITSSHTPDEFSPCGRACLFLFLARHVKQSIWRSCPCWRHHLIVQPAERQHWLLLRMLACSLFGLPGPSSVPWWPVRGSLVCATCLDMGSLPLPPGHRP